MDLREVFETIGVVLFIAGALIIFGSIIWFAWTTHFILGVMMTCLIGGVIAFVISDLF